MGGEKKRLPLSPNPLATGLHTHEGCHCSLCSHSGVSFSGLVLFCFVFLLIAKKILVPVLPTNQHTLSKVKGSFEFARGFVGENL